MWLAEPVLRYLQLLKARIEMNNAELAQGLRDVKTQVIKAKGEVVDKIAALETAVGNAGTVSPEVEAAFADLKTAAQSIDDVVPDGPAVGAPAGAAPTGQPADNEG